MLIRLRSILLLLLTAVAAVAVSACGGDSKEASADSDVNTLLEQTFSGNKKIESGRVALSLGINAKGAQGAQGPVTVKLGGPFQSQGKGKVPKFDMDLGFSGQGQSIQAGLTSTGDRGFVNFNNTDYAVSGQVFQQFEAGFEQAQKEAEKQQGGKQPSLATLGIDPRKWLTNAKNEGEAKVGDEDTIRITGGVDVPKFLDDVNTALDKTSQLGLQGGGQVPQKLTDEQRKQIGDAVKDLRVEIFTGKDDSILRRMLVDLDVVTPEGSKSGAQSAVVKLDLSLTELNDDQEIKAPEKTKPFDELLGQLGGLGGGLGALGGGGSGGSGSGGSGSGGGSAESQKQLEEYTQCITDAGSDTAKAQECAKLLGG